MKSAVSTGDSDKVHTLLKSQNHTSLEHVECPLLCIAASKGKKLFQFEFVLGYGDIIGLLLRHGIQVNTQSNDGSTALICAADNVGLN